MSTSTHQTSYRLLCQMLRGVLRDAVESGLGAEGIGSVRCRAVATLYGLLLDHPVDRRGRCRSCRRPGAVLGWRRRRCRVQITAHFYLHHPDDAFLLGHLARELGFTVTPPGTDTPEPDGAPDPAPVGDREDTEVLPQPDSDHGGAGDGSECSRFQVRLGAGRSRLQGGVLAARDRRPVGRRVELAELTR